MSYVIVECENIFLSHRNVKFVISYPENISHIAL